MAADNSDIIDIEGIMKMIPHRYPFLLIDRVQDVVPETSATGIKNVTINEPFFAGHFPDKPIMPGVLVIESMAQTAAALVVSGLGPETEGKLVYFMSVESARFRKPVIPGDQLEIKVIKKQSRGKVWKFGGQAFVQNTLVAESGFTAMISDK